MNEPFHSGELSIQERVGVRETVAPWAKIAIRDWMPDQHREFYQQLPFMVAAGRDDTGQAWATLLAGTPGFVQTPSANTLQINSKLAAEDPLANAIKANSELGMLGIELHTRRRNRVNGVVKTLDSQGITLAVTQSFGNCPQYITTRDWQSASTKAPKVTRSDQLTEDQQQFIEQADTFFIASGFKEQGMDASHRGGQPGFISVPDGRHLVFPDYAGNNLFNTLGNILKDPRVGLLFVDFANQNLLQLTGTAEILWQPSNLGDFPGAKRLIAVTITEVVWQQGVLPIKFTNEQGPAREVRLVNRHKESSDVTSFYFQSRDEGALWPAKAGQYLPLQFQLPNGTMVTRQYSLSNEPNSNQFRISVKRDPQGLVSRYLHDHLAIGDTVLAQPPAGEFVVKDYDKPLVLISGGIGITPTMAMLRQVKALGTSAPVHFIHSAKSTAHLALFDEALDIQQDMPNVQLTLAITGSRHSERIEEVNLIQGRITKKILDSLNLDPNAQFLICGPSAFAIDLQEALMQLEIENVQSETF